MAKVKRVVTISADVDRAARELGGENLSAFVNNALKRHIRMAQRATGRLPQDPSLGFGISERRGADGRRD
jgi:hypothetical protein